MGGCAGAVASEVATVRLRHIWAKAAFVILEVPNAVGVASDAVLRGIFEGSFGAGADAELFVIDFGSNTCHTGIVLIVPDVGVRASHA